VTTDIHTLVGAYVLDAVDDLERAAFDRHIRECASCREEVEELRGAAARLADGTWSVPPPRLRTNVMAAISETRQLSPAGPDRPRRDVSRWRRLTAAAAAVVAAVGAGTAVYAVQDQRVRREQARAEAAQASETRIRAILAAPDLVIHEQTLTNGGRVTVAESGLHNAGVIVLAAEAPPGDGRVYQLWTIRPGEDPVSAGVLAEGQSGTVQIVDGMPGVADVGVTIEPDHGSPKPTLPMVADVKVT
jgi:anti-sigma-K factor RskA